LAIRLALTGHLILTTVHANTAIQAISRLLDLGVEASMLAATTRLLLGQRLVKRLCPRCRQPHRDAKALIQRYGDTVDSAKELGLAGCMVGGAVGFSEAGGGCGACNRSGFTGRSGIFEFRDIRAQVAELLLRKRARFDPMEAESVFFSAAREGDIGSRSMREDGMVKAAFGLMTPEEVLGATMGQIGTT
jgi:general secretion pathway protein E